MKNCRKQQLFTDPQHNVKTYSVSNIDIYYLSGYFRRSVTFAIFSQTVRVVSNFAKILRFQLYLKHQTF